MLYYLSIALICFLHSVNCSPGVLELKGDPDFRSVRLEWKARKSVEDKFGFLITYCEDQAWGKHRCRKKVIDNEIDVEVDRRIQQDDNYHLYEATIDGLRIATNYTVEVKTTIKGESNPAPQRARALGRNLFIQTKEFHARAISCLANSSLVEIETGPYFGGKISVEGSTDERCATQGEYTNPRSIYLIDIDHSLCGSEMINTSVRTFVVVQENLPILTHSTRRFMVVCNYVPETFTVRAGVNLPDYEDYGNDLVPVGNDVFEVDPSELFDSTGGLFNSRVAKQIGKALKLSADSEPEESQKWAHLVLMVVLIMSAVVGVSCAVLHFVRQSRIKNRSGFMSPQVEPSAIEINENLEAVVRDFGEPQTGSADANSPSQPSVALTGADFDCGSDKSISEVSSGLTDFSRPTMTSQHVVDADDTMLQTCDSNTPIQITEVQNCHINTERDALASNSSMDSFPSFIPGNHCQSVSINNLENIDAVFDEILSISPAVKPCIPVCNTLINVNNEAILPPLDNLTDSSPQTGQSPPSKSFLGDQNMTKAFCNKDPVVSVNNPSPNITKGSKVDLNSKVTVTKGIKKEDEAFIVEI